MKKMLSFWGALIPEAALILVNLSPYTMVTNFIIFFRKIKIKFLFFYLNRFIILAVSGCKTLKNYDASETKGMEVVVAVAARSDSAIKKIDEYLKKTGKTFRGRIEKQDDSDPQEVVFTIAKRKV